MDTVKDIKIENLPKDFHPKTLSEILELTKKVKGNTALVYVHLNKLVFMETERLIIRRFMPEDTEAVYELANARMSSSMKDFDHQWPTDLEGCRAAVAYFSGEDIYYAVCLKPSMKLIGFIAYNSVDANGILDLGHVWHTTYQNNDLDTEALALMAQYTFEQLGINGVCARNPLECEEQIAPLKSIGMEIIDTNKASFVNDASGNPIEFSACWMLITRDKWEANHPDCYAHKNKPEILGMAETAQNDGLDLPPSAEIPFSGAIDLEGPPLVPHTRAFSSAVMSLTVLMGMSHDTHIIQAHNRTYRADHDYYRNLLVSGEGFLFWSDVWQYFTGTLPQGMGPDTWESLDDMPHTAEALIDCFEMAGMKAEIFTNYDAECINGGWATGEHLKNMVMRNIAEGFPVLMFSGDPGDRIILATGYQKGGEVLLSWVFSAGDDKRNKSFASDKCECLTNWDENIIAALLVKSTPQPPTDIRPLMRKALRRGVDFLRRDRKLEGFQETFDGSGEPHVYPEIWDLAERRCYLSSELQRVAELFGTNELLTAIDASMKIHDNMWRIDTLRKSKNGCAALKDAAVQKQIAEILGDCRQLDLRIADTISMYLNDESQPHQ